MTMPDSDDSWMDKAPLLADYFRAEEALASAGIDLAGLKPEELAACRELAKRAKLEQRCGKCGAVLC
jgi:hypothetical protein